MQEDLKNIAEYGLVDFCRRADELYQQGYRFDFANSLRVPCSYGSLFEAILVKQLELTQDTEVIPVVVPSLEPKLRKPKSIE